MSDEQKVIFLIILFGSIALHEFGHAKSADAAGDPTPRLMGRVTLNPIAHFDPLGAIMIVICAMSGFGIGWGKPVLCDPSKMQNPRWDGFMSVLWGPLTNVIIAVVCALLFRVVPLQEGNLPIVFGGALLEVSVINAFLYYAVIINISLALFNLIPLGPLDGHWLLGYLMPQPLGARYALWSRTQGTFFLLGIILMDQLLLRPQGHTGILFTIIDPPRRAILSLLLGG